MEAGERISSAGGFRVKVWNYKPFGVSKRISGRLTNTLGLISFSAKAGFA